jgi:hypothetical protein
MKNEPLKYNAMYLNQSELERLALSIPNTNDLIRATYWLNQIRLARSDIATTAMIAAEHLRREWKPRLNQQATGQELASYNEICRRFGVKRGYVYKRLCDGSIESFVKRQPGQKRGKRFIILASAEKFFKPSSQ